METGKDFIRQYGVALVLFSIVALGFFVRFYHFDEWLYFKMDQSRDALMISNAITSGPQYLPLLGPRVGAVKLEHGMLRLGPAYYYFQYLSGKIFQSTAPAVFAYPDLFFGVMVIPLLFCFARLYFSRWHALMVTAMYAFSFLIIQYSRFAWNPNALQFFIILSFYGLLRFLNEERPMYQKLWLVLWAVGVTIGSQLHFFGFFSLLGISGLLILSHLRLWQKSVWGTFFQKTVLKKFFGFVLVAAAVFFTLYAPVIISDSMKHGQNTHNFFEALGSKADKRPLAEKVRKDITENLNYYCLLTTSSCYTDDLRKNALPIAASATVGLLGLVLAVRGLRKTQKSPLAKDFLALLILWFGVFTILTIPVAFQLRPRFYIVVFALPFLFLGLLFEYLEERFGKRALLASLLITLAVLAVNMRGTLLWFGEQTRAQTTEITTTKRTLILKAKDGVTLGQLTRVTDWIYSRHRKGDTLYY
ncbi:MAG: phospholipid carrier-dependent glycosyltransferase, partial [Candidatus Moranbacteria bacterium]|nr:phospholipid carrier-dependent glycosyltransferase [Candidatus Moranbacteria bacterium]